MPDTEHLNTFCWPLKRLKQYCFSYCQAYELCNSWKTTYGLYFLFGVVEVVRTSEWQTSKIYTSTQLFCSKKMRVQHQFGYVGKMLPNCVRDHSGSYRYPWRGEGGQERFDVMFWHKKVPKRRQPNKCCTHTHSLYIITVHLIIRDRRFITS